MAKNGTRYNPEFKNDILRLINEEKRSVSSVAKDFGVNEQTVRNWLKKNIDLQDLPHARIAELEVSSRQRIKRLLIRS